MYIHNMSLYVCLVPLSPLRMRSPRGHSPGSCLSISLSLYIYIYICIYAYGIRLGAARGLEELLELGEGDHAAAFATISMFM